MGTPASRGWCVKSRRAVCRCPPGRWASVKRVGRPYLAVHRVGLAGALNQTGHRLCVILSCRRWSLYPMGATRSSQAPWHWSRGAESAQSLLRGEARPLPLAGAFILAVPRGDVVNRRAVV
jgi:hypothetical protein